MGFLFLVFLLWHISACAATRPERKMQAHAATEERHCSENAFVDEFCMIF